MRVLLVLGLALVAALALHLGAASAADARTFVVNSSADAVDRAPGDGTCAASGSRCTVRAAVQESNASAGPDRIEIPAGVYELQLPPANENGPEIGDWDIADSVTIVGAGSGTTILDGGFPGAGPPEQRGLDRLFEIHRTAGDVSISGVTLREGFSPEEGGAILNWSSGRLSLDAVHIRDSYASKSGGGIENADPSMWPCALCPSVSPLSLPGGRVEITNSTLSGNAAGGGGAAIANSSTGTVSILAGSKVIDNPGRIIVDPRDPTKMIPAPGVYEPGAGAITNGADGVDVGAIRVADATIANNTSSGNGAGILNAGSGSLTVERATVKNNVADGDGGGIYTAGGAVTISASTIADNKATGGAGVYSAGETSTVGLRSRVDVRGTTFSGNVAEASGGGMHNGADAQLSLTDVTFSANRAHDAGGGLENDGRASLVLTRGTFTANKADGEGGGLYTAAERPVLISASTFTGNSAGVPGEAGSDAGGGGAYTETGPVTISDSSFAGNTATSEGGGLTLDNFGSVTVRDTVVRDNKTLTDGGGVENSGAVVTFERLRIVNNTAGGEGGGIHNSSSGEFTVLDTTVQGNRAVNGGGFTNASDSTLAVRRSLFLGNTARRPANAEDPEEGGRGGGIYSVSDGAGIIENTTISGNTANVSGGGMFHDADAALRMVNDTVWRNSAPSGGGIAVAESDFVPTVPPTPHPLTLRNTIVGGSLAGGSCDAMLTSEGGNLDSGTSCMFAGPGDRGNSNPQLDAIADNGGPTLTHSFKGDSMAVDRGRTPCVETDQRGVTRPKNRGCDAGAFEYEGPVAPLDESEPDTEYVSGPVQDSLETIAFQFTGSDDQTPEGELAFECRLLEESLTEPPEPTNPFEPLPPEFQFVSCASGWQAPLVEEGIFTFEVRAIDRAGNKDPTPARHVFNGTDTSPPNTLIVEKPANPTSSRAATFTFSGTDNLTPPEFMEYECRLDSRDPEAWVECFNPTFYSNLTAGSHTLEVRATDGNENVDPTPARYTWTVGEAETCDQANITLTASADAWVDEVNPGTNHLFDTDLTVRSAQAGNARALVRFALPAEAADCELEGATLRMHAGSSTAGRTLQAVPLAAGFSESRLTWANQPGTRGTPATTAAGDGYREWNVLDHVRTMLESGVSHGWSIRDAAESAADGGDQSFDSREAPQDPPDMTLPELVLVYEADGTPPPPPAPAPADETTVRCGQILTQSTLVGNDLTNCPGEGLIIGAPNITVDLNGHVIDGPDYLLENGSGQEEGFPAGIRIGGHDNVVIRNGTVQQFGWGVLLAPGTTHTVVEDLKLLRHATAGVELFDADDGRSGNTVRDNTIKDNELGVALVGGSNNSTVSGNVIHGNLGEQILVRFGGGHRIVGNDVVGIPTDPTLDSDGGVLLEGTSNNVFDDNTLRETGDAGVVISAGANNNTLTGNTMYRNGDAGVIISDSDRNTIVDLTSHQQSDGGVVLNDANDTVVRDSDLRFNPSGVEASGTNDLVLERNDASDSLQSGLAVGGGLNIRIVGNTAHRTGGAGISLEGGAFDAAGAPIGGALIQGNRTNENRADGITVAAGGHRIAGNVANNNAGYGIGAEDDAVDGGGNKASGNARPEQCTGVICDTSGSEPVSGGDTTAPVTSIDSSPAASTGSTSATFTFSATDATTPPTAMVYECRLDPGPDPVVEPEPDPDPPSPNEPPEPPDTPPDGDGWAECVSPITYADLDPGEHRFEVRARDQGDNRDLTPAVHVWTIEPGLGEDEPGPESTPPDTRIAAAPANVTTSTAATFRFAGTDNQTVGPNLRFECRLDPAGASTPFTACTSPRLYEGLAQGPHTFEVRAIDRSGNADTTPAVHTWTVLQVPTDTVAPETTLVTTPDATTVQTSARFTFSTDDAEATYECSLDGAAFTACTTPKEYTGLATGEHTLRVRAKDPSGNLDATPATHTWRVTTAPVSATIACGQRITRSIVVRNDLADCLADGILVGANDITIDLGGRKIDGVGLGAAVRNDGFDNVTIKNGTLSDFDFGVALNTGTARNIVEGVTFERHQEAGIGLGHAPSPTPPGPQPGASGVTGNILRDNSLTGNKLGMWLANATRETVVRGNTFGANDGAAVYLEVASANRIEDNDIAESSKAAITLEGASDNVIARNTLGGNGGGVELGLTLRGTVGLASNGNRVEANVIDDSGGVLIENSDRNQILDNTINRNTEGGVELSFARDTLVKGNDLRANKGGIALKNSSRNRLEANDTSRSQGTGISLEALSLSNVLLRNTSSNNDGDGIYVGDETGSESGMLIEGNVTNDNKTYGIHVPKVSHTIKGNVANDNGSWGIYASEGSNGRVNIDGGGNRAMGNVGPLDPFTGAYLQCFSVRCDGGTGAPSDQIAPDTSILEAPPAITVSDEATFRFSGTDNAGTITFQCRLDSQDPGAFQACESPETYTVVPGSHTLEVRAVDASGNVDASPAKHTWFVQPRPAGVAPETTITTGPDLTTVSTDARFEFTADERDATFECALDGAAFAPCNLVGIPGASLTTTKVPVSFTGLAVGAHTFRVRATDGEGNVDATPATWNWTVGAPPAATDVSCGEILVRSVKVTNDLVDCPGNALIAGAPGITIDLDGHVVDGVGIGSGIVVNGQDSVTVTNGTVTEFATGVQLNPGTGLAVLSGLRVEANEDAGIALSDADDGGKGVIVRGNTVIGNGVGVGLYAGTRNAHVHDNALGANTVDGVRLEQAAGVRVERNEITDSGGPGVALEGGTGNTVLDNAIAGSGGPGVAVGAELIPADDNRIERNRVSASNGPGIAVTGSTGNDVLFNVVRESNGGGATLELARDTLVRGNDLRSNAEGVTLSQATANRIESNNASDAQGTGIAIETASLANVVVDNAASSNGGEGIHVADSAPSGQGNRLERNVASSNGGDGILVGGVNHTITANVAQLNGGWGVYAPLGAIDGGGNSAGGNAEAAQCQGVVCSRTTVPGAPDTEILSKPANPSSSRNASFTYTGSDASTPLHELTFECRLDSTSDADWVDCEYPQEYRNLSPGQHTFEIRAIDSTLLADPTPATYTWTYQPLPANVGPEVVIDLKPEAETMSFEAIFTFHANEPDVTFECRIDTLPYEPCGFDTVSDMSRGAYEAAIEENQPGRHTFSVRATDFEGNRGPVTTYSWNILGVATEFLSGPGFTPGAAGEPATGGEVQETTATIDFRANVGDATFECSLDREPFGPCEPPVTYTDLLPGAHELRVIATDLQGVSEAEAAVYEWEILEGNDTTPPDTLLERAPASGTSSTLFEFTGTDDLTPASQLTYQCRLDSTSELAWEPCESPYNLLDVYTYADVEMAPGRHTFEVRAVDAADPQVPDPNNPNFEGNVDPTPAVHTWISVADTTAPGTGITAGPAARTADPDAVFEFFATDNATPELALTFECAIDNGAYEPCSSPESVQGLEPGTHTFRVRAVDLMGNRDATPATRTWTIVPAATTTITSGPPAVSTSESVIFRFTANQPGSTFECALDGGDFVPCVSPRAVQVGTEGAHTFEVRSTNPEGIVEDPPVAYEWTAELGPDTRPPDTVITNGPNFLAPELVRTDPSTVATFTFTGTDTRTETAQLTFECALDGTAFNSCESPQQFSDLGRGPHVMLIRARDAAGNFDPTPARYQWTVQPPPVTTIVGPDTTELPVTFTFTSDVPGSTFECWLDGPKGPCTSPVTYTDLPLGEHIFAVRATDPGGNRAPLWEELEFEVVGDTTAPITTITSGPGVSTEETSARFTFTADEPGATFECSLDGAAFGECTSPVEIPRLAAGEHRFEVQAVKPGMSADPVPVAYEWTILDATAPDTTIDSGPPASTSSVNAYFTFGSDDPTATFECSLDGASFGACESPAEYLGLERAAHRLEVRAVDAAGNEDPTPAVRTWTITGPPPNNTPPGTNVTVQVPMPDHAGTASLTFAGVTVAGATTIEALPSAPPPPFGYSVVGARFYDISTTAEYEPPVTVCLTYDASAYGTTAIRLLHYDGSVWEDLTTTNDPATGRVCAEVETLSPFAIAAATSGVAPETSLISGPPALSTSNSATFEFIADQPGATLQCSIDGEPFVACESPMTYTQLGAGAHDFQVQAVSEAGIVDPTPVLYEWTIELGPDTTAPETSITKGPPALSGSLAAAFEFTGTDDQSLAENLEFECSLDGVVLGSCSSEPLSPYAIELTTAGEHRFEVVAIDEAGNRDPTPAVRTWTVVDLSAPDTSIDSGPESETELTTATFEFTGEKPDGTIVTAFECALDTAEYVSCDSPHTVDGLAAGPHTMRVRAKDPAGNVDPTPDVYEWLVTGTVGTEAPDTTILSAPGNVSGPEVRFAFGSDKLTERFECSLDGAAFQDCEGVHEIVGLATGAHTLAVRAVDLEGAVDGTPATHAWTVLGTPQTTIDSKPDNPSASVSGTFTFSSDQDGVTFQCSIDGSEFTPCTSPYVAGPLATEEEHEFQVRAVSPFRTLENLPVYDETPASYSWLVDIPPDTLPEASITAGPSGVTAATIATFRFASNDVNATLECSLDDAAFTECESPYELTGLTAGEHTFRVRAVDALDNAGPAVSRTWTVEAAPDTEVLTGPEAETSSREATFTFSSPLADATFECSLDGAAFTECESPVTFTGIPYGEHELLVRAKAPAGTVDGTPAEFSWASGHLTAPETTLLSSPDAETTSTAAAFSFESSDPDATFQCRLDDQATFTPCASPKEYGDLAVGPHTFAVQAIKPDLLASPEPVVHTWTVVDDAAPETTITGGPSEPTGETSATFTFTGADNTPAADLTFECSLDGGPFEACDSPHEVQDLAPGEHTLEVRAVDAALTADPTPASRTWTVVGAPVTTITAGPENPTTSTSATFAFTANALGATFTCSLDGAAPVDCSSGHTVTGLAAGDHTLAIVATNALGMAEEPAAVYEWTVVLPPDTTVPETSITTAPPVEADSTDATFTFLADPAGGTFECRLDAQTTFTSCSSPLELTGLAEGEHRLEVRAISVGGFADASPAVHEWTIDLAPETTIVTAPETTTVDTTAAFAFSSNDPAADFECQLDASGSWGSCEPTTQFANLAVGDHTLSVRAKDAAGNVDATPATHAWTVTPLPDTTLTATPEEATEATTATFEFTSDQGTRFECRLDDAPAFTACDSPQTYTDLPAGEHDFLVRAVDAAGNPDPTPASWSWEIGDVPPAVTIDGKPDATTESTSATFAFSAPETGTAFECSLDGGPYAPCASPTTYTGLELGPHTFAVRVLSPTAVVEPPVTTVAWSVVDGSAPDTAIESAPLATIGADTASVSFSSEAGATFECSLNGAPFEACTSPEQLSGLTPGEYTFAVRAIDPSGNEDATPATARWTVVAPPETTLATPSTTDYTTTTARFTFSSPDADATFECALDTGAFEPCTSPHEVTGLTDGNHTFLVRARSAAGIADATPEELDFTVTLPPDTTITSGPELSTTSTVARFTLSANEPGVAFECALDGADFTPCPEPVEFSGLALGRHVLLVRAVDGSSTPDPTPATFAWTVTPVPDTTAPQTTLGDTPAASSAATTARFSFTANEAGTFECSLDDAPFAACTSPVELDGLSVGGHTFAVRAVDGAGNPDASPATFTWTVEPPPDTTAPVVAMGDTPERTTTDTAARFTFTAEAGATFECRLDGAAFATCDSPQAFAGLAVGDHTFSVRATDAAGNAGEPATYAWTITEPPDTSAPSVTFAATPKATTSDTSATFAFTASESGSTFACVLDGDAPVPCTSPRELTGLTLGDHVFQVTATDAAGNTGAPESFAWTVTAPPDTVAPETTLGDTPPSTTTDTSATFTFSSSELGSTYACSLDGAAFATCAAPVELTGLDVGAHTFAVRAIDAAGNADASPASHTWTVEAPADRTPPQTTLGDTPAASSAETSARFTFTSDEPGSTFECSVDDGAAEVCSSPLTLSDLSVGGHTLSVTAIDAAGNRDASPVAFAWTVLAPPDTTAPEVTVGDKPQATTTETGARFTFSADEDATFECRLDDGAFAACSSPQTYDGLSLNAHEFTVRATDAAGNVSRPVTHRWTVEAPKDTTAPSVTITTKPAATTTETTATFAFTANEAGSTFACKLDGDAFAACTSPRALSGLALGGHVFQVQATDAAGNVGAPESFSWTVEAPADTTAPETTLGDRPAATTTATTARFTFTASEAGSRFECALDSAPFAACASPREYTGLAVGSHQLRVRAIDAAGNVDATPAVHDWRIDAPAPTCTGTPTTLPANADAWVDQGSSSSNKGTDSVLKVMSKAGANLRALVRFANPPRPAGCVVASAKLRLYAASTRSGRTLQALRVQAAWTENGVTWGNQPATTGTAATTASGTGYREFDVKSQLQAMYDANANHGFLVRDAAEGADAEQQFNAREKGQNVPQLVVSFGPPPAADTTPPETTLGAGSPPATTTSTSATFAFSSDEADASFECSLDGAAFAACSSPKEYTGLAVGSHEVKVRAKDAAGNVDGSPATHAWTIQAATGCTAGSTSTLGANGDAWVLQSSASSNHGADSVLKVDSKNGGNARALVRFPLPSVPAGCQVMSATLRLYAGSYKSGRSLQAIRLSGTWAENSVNWNTMPGSTGTAATAPSRSSSGYVEWAVTAQVQAMYAGANHGFLIRDATENGSGVEQAFNSREKGSDNPPQLVVRYG